MTRSTLRTLRSLVVLALAGAGSGTFALPLRAQELPWLPRGKVSLDFAPSFWTWDARYGIGPGGAKRVEPLGLDLSANPLGSDALPQLRQLESSLGQALDDSSFRVRLGVSQALVEQSVLTFPFRLDVGVTDWLTVGAMVPLVRPRSEILFALDADSLSANVGPSPWNTNLGAVSGFLVQLQSVLDQAGTAFPDNAEVAAAQAYLDALTRAYGQGTVFPVTGSQAGRDLQGRLDEIRTALDALGFPGAPETLPLAGAYFEQESFGSFLTGPAMRGWPLESWTTLWSLGDVELTAAARVLRGGFEPDSLGNLPFFRYQLGVGGLVRLPTGDSDDPNRFLDVSPADGQMDLEGSVFGLVELGSRLGAWGHLRYGVQRKGTLIQRIAGPGEVLPNYGRLAPLYRTPGNYLELDLNPRVFLTPAMSFGIRLRSWSKGEDSHALQPIDPETLEKLAYPPAELLDQETEQSLHEVGFSATYSSVEAFDRGEASLPVYLRLNYLRAVSGSGGQTPKGGRFEAGLTLYRTLWGRAAAASGPTPPPTAPGRAPGR